MGIYRSGSPCETHCEHMLNWDTSLSPEVGELMEVKEIMQTHDLLENKSNDEFMKKSMGNDNLH